MDILHLVDRLEEIVKGSTQLPFSGLRLVDERRLWPLLDQMRISIPDEVRRAERIIREKERTIAQAQEEAERIVALARSEAAQLTAEHTIAQAAEARAVSIREQAKREAQGVRIGADDYAFDVLCKLDQDLRRTLTVIENGIRTIQAERDVPEQEVPECIHPKLFHHLIWIHHVPPGFGHLLALGRPPSVAEYALWGLEASSHQNCRPYDCMKLHDILPYDMKVGRPKLIELLWIHRISNGRDIVR